MNQEYYIKAYEEHDALWMHDGNSESPHALLTAGKHSDGFFNSRPVLADDKLLQECVEDLIDNLEQRLGSDILRQVDMVVGPQTGGTKLAEFICREIVRRGHDACRWASPAKGRRDDDTRFFYFEEGADRPQSYMNVLLCEDVVTTGGSVEDVIDLINNEYGAHLLPTVVALVNRGGLTTIRGKSIAALIDQEMSMWDPDECPLCKRDSGAIRPKDNWAKLTGKT